VDYPPPPSNPQAGGNMDWNRPHLPQSNTSLSRSGFPRNHFPGGTRYVYMSIAVVNRPQHVSAPRVTLVSCHTGTQSSFQMQAYGSTRNENFQGDGNSMQNGQFGYFQASKCPYFHDYGHGSARTCSNIYKSPNLVPNTEDVNGKEILGSFPNYRDRQHGGILSAEPVRPHRYMPSFGEIGSISQYSSAPRTNITGYDTVSHNSPVNFGPHYSVPKSGGHQTGYSYLNPGPAIGSYGYTIPQASYISTNHMVSHLYNNFQQELFKNSASYTSPTEDRKTVSNLDDEAEDSDNASIKIVESQYPGPNKCS